MNLGIYVVRVSLEQIYMIWSRLDSRGYIIYIWEENMKINLTDEMLVQFKDFKITSENINIRKDTQFKHLITFHFLSHTKMIKKKIYIIKLTR